jgi:hypothetical protein
MQKEDMALNALKAVAQEGDFDIDQDLIVKAYTIQKAHQFDRDRAISLQKMQALIDQYAEQNSSES